MVNADEIVIVVYLLVMAEIMVDHFMNPWMLCYFFTDYAQLVISFDDTYHLMALFLEPYLGHIKTLND